MRWELVGFSACKPCSISRISNRQIDADGCAETTPKGKRLTIYASLLFITQNQHFYFIKQTIMFCKAYLLGRLRKIDAILQAAHRQHINSVQTAY